MKRTSTPTESTIQAACSAYSAALLAALPDTDTLAAHRYSDSFRARLDALIEALPETLRRKRRAVTRRRSLIVLAAVFAILVSLLAVSAATDGPLIHWLRETYTHQVVYRFFGEPVETPLPHYSLGWIPEGFELCDSGTEENEGFAVYENIGSDESFVFEYRRASSDYEVNIIFAQEQVEYIPLNNVIATYYEADDTYRSRILLWADETESALFTLTGAISKEDMIQIAAGLSND